MVTQEQFKQHYYNLYANKAVYVWGANGEKITKDLTDRLYRCYGSATFTKLYYNNKFKEGQGRIGADCSGSIYPLSKKDNTARGYYNECKQKGAIQDMPKNVACLIFNSNFTHVGAYLGNGITIEMMNSRNNCVKQNFNKSRWAYYGIPTWLDTTVNKTTTSSSSSKTSSYEKEEVIKNIQRWCNQYCDAQLKIDGDFGPKTKEGLCKALQLCLNSRYKAKLKVDGKFGEETKSKCKVASSCKELTYICQAMLFCKGYDLTSSIKNNKLDGNYGKGTKAAVMEFQQNTRGLKYDGKCGKSTFYALFN
jgi:peptidoglycan hydrolase-like protein with peptidoglycan-binding domain